ncbi:unnamed protein product [Oikopleura dioica]|uniref:Uncharacterized protein n=1 Tax=Oikopleura dioica TaxID=34765 RepID=E4YMI9_OIKDI|nr:unnamed protein product [Oikopleura dioica]
MEVNEVDTKRWLYGLIDQNNAARNLSNYCKAENNTRISADVSEKIYDVNGYEFVEKTCAEIDNIAWKYNNYNSNLTEISFRQEESMEKGSAETKSSLYGVYEDRKHGKTQNTERFNQQYMEFRETNHENILPSNISVATPKNQGKKMNYRNALLTEFQGSFQGNQRRSNGPRGRGNFGTFVPTRRPGFGGNNFGTQPRFQNARPAHDWTSAPGRLVDKGFCGDEVVLKERDEEALKDRKKWKIGGNGANNEEGTEIKLDRMPNQEGGMVRIDFTYWTMLGSDNKFGKFVDDSYEVRILQGAFTKIRVLPASMIGQDNLYFSFLKWHNNPQSTEIFRKALPITSNVRKIQDWDRFWIAGKGLFEVMYKKGNSEILLTEPWIPTPWRNQVWCNHVLTWASGHVVLSALRDIGVDITRVKNNSCIEVELIFLRKEGDNQVKYVVYNTATDTDTIHRDELICGIKFKDAWPMITFVFFCRRLLARCEPFRYASNAERFAAIFSLIDLNNPREEKCEFQPTLSTGQIMKTCYDLFSVIKLVMHNMCYNLSCTDNETINFIGLVGLDKIFAPSSEIMKNFMISNKDYMDDLQKRSVCYTPWFQQAVNNDRWGFTWRILWDQKYRRIIETPVSARETMVGNFKSLADMQNVAARGRSSQTTDAIIYQQNISEREMITRRVQNNADKNYLSQLSEDEDYKNHFNEQIGTSESFKNLLEQNKKLKEEVRLLKQGENWNNAGANKRKTDEMEIGDDEDLSPGAPLASKQFKAAQNSVKN